MKKVINRTLRLLVVAVVISSTTNYPAGRGYYANNTLITKARKAEIKKNSRKETSLNKQLNSETAKLAELESYPDTTKEAIEAQKNKVDAKKEEALSWLQKTYKSATEMTPTAKALVATAAVAGAAVTADWYFGTGYVSGAANWLYNKMPSRETFGFGKKSLSDMSLRELSAEGINRTKGAVSQALDQAPAQIIQSGKRLAQQTAQRIPVPTLTEETSAPYTREVIDYAKSIPGRVAPYGRRMAEGLQTTAQRIPVPTLTEETSAPYAEEAVEFARETAKRANEWIRQPR